MRSRRNRVPSILFAAHPGRSSRVASRSFRDSDGVPWTVWEVRPDWAERRTGTDRRQSTIAEERQVERRRITERRGTQTEARPRIRIAEEYANGWLAFESSRERKRLAPIPADWESYSDMRLAELTAQAREIPSGARRLDE
jgi:hypothetical protein